MNHAPLAVVVLPQPPHNASRTVQYPHYIYEILDHAGVFYDRPDVEKLFERLPDYVILMTVGEGQLAQEHEEKLRAWVASGGEWIAVAGLCGLADLFGVEPEKPAYAGWAMSLGNLGEGYMRVVAHQHSTVSHIPAPLHFFNGLPVQLAGASPLAQVLDGHQRPTNRTAMAEYFPGKGHTVFIAPDITGTVVRIQLGIGVTRDGVSAPDGTAPVADNVLKSGDGGVLDWWFDRDPVPGLPDLNGYLRPIADQWRELLLRAVFCAATRAQVALPLLWLYPRNLPALACMSHDTDGNEPAKCDELLQVLQEVEIKSTWCTILPGYDRLRMKRIAEAGHELAMHYDAMSEGLAWGEEQFDQQYRALTTLFGGDAPVTNKNHYLRWEGDCDLFRWCEKCGIQLDQSKGASKAGEFGFNFGTCHLYFPVTFSGEKVDVLEMPTPTQDLEVFVPAEAADALMDAVARAHGVYHVLFHPAHIDKPGVGESLKLTVLRAQQGGMEWWTAAELANWERARRGAQFTAGASHDEVVVTSQPGLKDVTVLWLLPEPRAGCTIRWGFPFSAEVISLAAGESRKLRNTTIVQGT